MQMKIFFSYLSAYINGDIFKLALSEYDIKEPVNYVQEAYKMK